MLTWSFIPGFHCPYNLYSRSPPSIQLIMCSVFRGLSSPLRDEYVLNRIVSLALMQYEVLQCSWINVFSFCMLKLYQCLLVDFDWLSINLLIWSVVINHACVGYSQQALEDSWWRIQTPQVKVHDLSTLSILNGSKASVLMHPFDFSGNCNFNDLLYSPLNSMIDWFWVWLCEEWLLK